MKQLHDFLTLFLPLLALSVALAWGLVYPGPAAPGPPLPEVATTRPFPSFPASRGGVVQELPPPAPAPRFTTRQLFAAIRQVESGGNDNAVGDGGLSLGPYQITKPYWQEACEHLGVDWDYETFVWNRGRCEDVMVAYWDRWKAGTGEARARMHNGGPRGHRKQSTLNYWWKVKRVMEKK